MDPIGRDEIAGVSENTIPFRNGDNNVMEFIGVTNVKFIEKTKNIKHMLFFLPSTDFDAKI